MSQKERTINRKSFIVVVEELRQHFPELVTDQKGNLALSYEQVKERLDDVLGLNYSFETSLDLIEMGTKKVLCGLGTITIFDDEGNVVCKRMQGGGADVIIPKQSGEPSDLSNDYTRAITDIFKKTCKMLSLDDQLQELRNKGKYQQAPITSNGTVDKNSKGEKEGNKKGSSKSAVSKSSSKPNNYLIVTEDYNSSCENKVSYKIKVTDKDGREGALVFWKNNADEVWIKRIKSLKAKEIIDIDKMSVIEKLYNNEIQFHAQPQQKAS